MAKRYLQSTSITRTRYLHFASMSNTTSPFKPKLAAPGAGLPGFEHFIANLMVHTRARRTTREQAAATFAEEQAHIMKLLSGRDDAALTRPVLIKRLRGLEDSSRCWSLLMVVDHLRIVNHEIAEAISALCAGRLPTREASIAGVKPTEQVTAAVIAEFDQGCRQLSETAAAQATLKTSLKFPHPWFGPLDAAAWHFMAGFHMRLHRKQMESILAGLAQG